MLSTACSIRRVEPEGINYDGDRGLPDSWERTLHRAEARDSSLDSRSLLSYIRRYLGAPYREGGVTPEGFDCSGLVVRLFEDSFGVTLPHNSFMIYQESKPLNKRKPILGDLLFFKTGSDGKINHVGVYIVGTKFVHSSSERGVVISDLRSEYYKKNFAAIRRFEISPTE